MMMIKLLGFLFTLPFIYLLYIACFKGFSAKVPTRMIECMFYGGIVLFFLGIMGMISCQAAPVCRGVCVPGDECKRVCKPEGEWL